jgi:hypothetical protein
VLDVLFVCFDEEGRSERDVRTADQQRSVCCLYSGRDTVVGCWAFSGQVWKHSRTKQESRSRSKDAEMHTRDCRHLPQRCTGDPVIILVQGHFRQSVPQQMVFDVRDSLL